MPATAGLSSDLGRNSVRRNTATVAAPPPCAMWLYLPRGSTRAAAVGPGAGRLWDDRPRCHRPRTGGPPVGSGWRGRPGVV